METNNMSLHRYQKVETGWNWIELVAVLIGLTGTTIACLSSYSWNWSKESMFFVAWSVLPYGLLLVGSHIGRRFVESRFFELAAALVAIAVVTLSLIVYGKAVLRPNHSSGMVFFILPLCWMIAIPILITMIVIGFLAVARWYKSQHRDDHNPIT